MRFELLWNIRLLCERLAAASLRRRRLERLRKTPACDLSAGHIESLELLEMARKRGIEVIYDIGANIGTWTLLAKAIIPEASVEAFEPFPAHCEGFAKACRAVTGITLHPVALGSANAPMLLRVASYTDSSSILELAQASFDHFGLTETDLISIPVRRLDDYIAEKKLAAPDLIKLDIQGFELEALRGGASALAHARALIVEVSFVELYKNQCKFSEVCEFLDRRGFSVHALGPSTSLGSPLVQADVLLLKR